LTSRDVEIFRQLSRYQFLRSNFLYAFAGGDSETRFKERLGNLYHEGFIDRPARQWELANCRYVPTIYELGTGGRRALQEQGVADIQPITFLAQGAQRQFSHAAMICDILASVELAARGSVVRFIPWPEILAKAPETTRKSERPYEIPFTSGRSVPQGGPMSAIVPDGLFGLQYSQTNPVSYRFFALEADRATMPVTRSDPSQSSILRKIAAYHDIMRAGLHKQRWKIPNLVVLTVTTNAQNLAKMISATSLALGARSAFLFSLSEAHGWPPKTIKPNPGFLQEPWEREGLSSLCIAEASSI